MIPLRRRTSASITLDMVLVIALCGAVLCTGNLVAADTVFRYRNPVIDRYLADPFILPVGGSFYLFATGRAPDGRFVPIYRSGDLVHWEFVRGAVTRGPEGSWNRKNFWAPEVIEIDGRFCLYYTASTDSTPQNTGNRVGLAVSDSPGGPYDDRGVIVPNASLDGSPFRDDDGVLYLYYTIEHGNSSGLTAGHIYVDRLVSPDRVAGNPVLLMSGYSWQEGPCVLHRNGRYFLTFSTGSWKKDNYMVHWAVGESAAGPFREQPGALLKSTDQVKGPGHHNFFVGPGGQDWIIYHGWDPGFTARYPRIDPLVINGDVLSTVGPTSTPQSFKY